MPVLTDSATEADRDSAVSALACNVQMVARALGLTDAETLAGLAQASAEVAARVRAAERRAARPTP